MTPDGELLRRYAKARSEEAFAELVQRHANLVYSAALRQVNGDAHLARDIAQTVFTDLARKAGSLARRELLTGWLYTSTHFAAAKIVRTENRRRDREETFMREPIQNSGTGVSPVHPVPEADWEKLRPVLDQAMHELKETDREAVLLRYFENQQFAELGAKLGLNENAARMRVERALEKLRTIFAKRGITTATALSSVISANAVQLAPANLAATLTTASVASAGTGTFTLLKIMTATRLKLGVSALVVAGAATALVVQHQTQTQLRAENDSLRQQIAQLQTDNENLSNRLNSASAPPSLPDNQLNELLRLRSEVGTLRRQTNEIERLKMEVRAATQNPNRQNDSQPDPQREIARLELDHIHQLTLGVVTFANDHQGQFPTDFDRIAKYLHSDELRTNLGNWEIVYRGSLTNLLDPSSIIVVRESQPLLYNGKWVKSYGFADGHCEAHEEANGNFDAWEQQRMVSPPTTQ